MVVGRHFCAHSADLIGVVPYFAYKWLNKLTKEKAQPVSLFVAGVLGSATNTILVMNMIYFLLIQLMLGIVKLELLFT